MSLRELANEKLIEGIKKCYANGDSLLNDAFTLGESKKFSRAYTLGQLAIEEFAKVPLLLSVLIERLEGNNVDYDKYEKTFKDHTLKTELGIDWEIAMWKHYKQETGKDFVDKLIDKSNEYRHQLKELNDLKNESLYVSIKDNEFQSPTEVFNEDKFNSIMGIASFRKIMLQRFTNINEKFIEELKTAIGEDSADNVEPG
jgi:AbiV family abortive infection protein